MEMTIAARFSIPTFLILMAMAGVTVGSQSYFRGQKSLNFPVYQPVFTTPTPTLEPAPKIQTTDVHSPDGAYSVILQSQATDNNLVRFSLFTQHESTKQLFYSTTGVDGEVSLSPNSWSPDNKYLFVTQNNTNALVFKASGEDFGTNEKFIDVVSLFQKSGNNYIFRDVTGWDSETLLHVRTKKNSGEKGPSFWFDVPSRSFIQLAS